MLDRDRGLRFSMASYYQDTTIPFFLNVSTDRFEALLRSATQSLHDSQHSKFQPYLLPGENHVLSNDWGALTADGQRFDTWVFAMIQGDDAWKEIEAVGP